MIEGTTLVLLIVTLFAGFYSAWSIGANDVANVVGTAVGSRALTLFQAVIIAAIFEFAGAFFLGGNVSETVEGGIVNPDIFSDDVLDYVYGMLSALLAAGVWLQIASYFGWPVSTTHAIVGAVVGFGLVEGGLEAIYWGRIGSIALSWILSPLLGGAIAYMIFSFMRRKIFFKIQPVEAAKRVTPYLVFFVFTVLSLIIFFGGLSGLLVDFTIFETIGTALLIGLISAIISFFLVRRIATTGDPKFSQNLQVAVELRKVQKHLGRLEASAMGELQDKAHTLLDEVSKLSAGVEGEEVRMAHSEYQPVENIFVYLQIITACFMALAHGSNDVANAIGPMAAIVNVLRGVPIIDAGTVPVWLLLLGGVGIVIGLATWGWRVIETVGKKITQLTPSRGFAASFGAATTVILATKLGLPVSTTHVIVGAILGVGLARGIGAINLITIRDIFISWVVTLPAGAVLAVLFFYALRTIFS